MSNIKMATRRTYRHLQFREYMRRCLAESHYRTKPRSLVERLLLTCT